MRRFRRRKVGYNFNTWYYKPQGVPLSSLDEVVLTSAELEVLRLRFIEKKKQVEASKLMGISQSQYQRDLVNALEKITTAIIEGKAIRIEERKQ